MTVVLERSQNVLVVRIHGRLRAPRHFRLREEIQALLARGERAITLCLSRVNDIDAAGVGELVRVFNMAAAANGALRVVHANGRVREVLDRTGLLEMLSTGITH